MGKGKENKEIKSWMQETVPNKINEYKAFRKVFGKNFAKEKLKENLKIVFSDEYSSSKSGEYDTRRKAIMLYYRGKNDELLHPKDIEQNENAMHTIVHESIHSILKHKGCDTGIAIEKNDILAGRGINEGYTEWLCSKLGYDVERSGYHRNINIIEQLELGIGEENTLRLGKGNLKNMAKILKMSEEEMLIFMSETDQMLIDDNRMQVYNKIVSSINTINNPNFSDKQKESAEKFLENEKEFKDIDQDKEYLKYLKENGIENSIASKKKYFEEKSNELLEIIRTENGEIQGQIYDRYFKKEFENIQKNGKMTKEEFEKYSKYVKLIQKDKVEPEKMEKNLKEFSQQFGGVLTKQYDMFLADEAKKIDEGNYSTFDMMKASVSTYVDYQNKVDESIFKYDYIAKYHEFLSEKLGKEDKETVLKIINELQNGSGILGLSEYKVLKLESFENGKKLDGVVYRNNELDKGIRTEITKEEYREVLDFCDSIRKIDEKAILQIQGKNLIVKSNGKASYYSIDGENMIPAKVTGVLDFSELKEKKKEPDEKIKEEKKKASVISNVRNFIMNKIRRTKALPESSTIVEVTNNNKKEEFISYLQNFENDNNYNEKENHKNNIEKDIEHEDDSR